MLISIQIDYSDRTYYGIPLVLIYATVCIVEITSVKFIVFAFTTFTLSIRIGSTISRPTHTICYSYMPWLLWPRDAYMI